MRKVAREEQTFMIQEMAAGDLQDAELIRLKKFLTVQHFLRHMLKSKVEKLREIYEPYEHAFFRIKSSTVLFYFTLDCKMCWLHEKPIFRIRKQLLWKDQLGQASWIRKLRSRTKTKRTDQ